MWRSRTGENHERRPRPTQSERPPESRVRPEGGQPYGAAMVSVSELQAHVASSYDRLGLPSWPDPHPGRESPRDEEHSRVTDPERYRVVHARARIWAELLVGALGVCSWAKGPWPSCTSRSPARTSWSTCSPTAAATPATRGPATC
jgi:hypothetical protein